MRLYHKEGGLHRVWKRNQEVVTVHVRSQQLQKSMKIACGGPKR